MAIKVGEYFYQTGQREEARRLVIDHHYSHRLPHMPVFVATLHRSGGLFGDMGEAVAALFISIPTTAWKEKNLELSRLVKIDQAEAPLSRLISLSMFDIKNVEGGDLIISYADPEFDHHGGIYQACSWNFSAKRKPIFDGYFINGKFHHRRTLDAVYKTTNKNEIEKIFKSEATLHFNKGKYLYWKATKKSGIAKAKRLGLKSLPYPKPDKE